MTKSTKKPLTIILSASRDIPFDKLVLSQSNVRRIKAGVSVEELAEDIARRGLLQGLCVRPVVDAEGAETGMFEIPAGGRRYRALELLVKQKRLAKTAPVPCIVRMEGIAEEDSLAENVQRAPLHPLDQFRAFLTLKEKGQSEEEIAAHFFVSVNVVKQRLKLASVSSNLLDIYAEDGMTLDQLMAFTVSGDQERQEQVFERLQQSYDKAPYLIRRMLTEGAVRASDKRAMFIGLDAYAEAGGTMLRDLFEADNGGWLQDVALVERMVTDKLNRDAATIVAEGWKWIETAPEFPYGHNFGLRRLIGEPTPITPEEQAARDALEAEYEKLQSEYDSAEELPEAVDERLGEIETALDAFSYRPPMFDPEDISRAGAFVSIAVDGALRVERGFVRPEDEIPTEPESVHNGAEEEGCAPDNDADAAVDSDEAPEPDEDDGLSLISDRLMTELTAFRTLGLRQTLGDRPDIAFIAALHALTLKAFYHYAQDTCLEIDLKSTCVGVAAQGLNESPAAEAIQSRHDAWQKRLPQDPIDLWNSLQKWSGQDQAELFAYIVSLSVNATFEAYNRRPRALAHAGRLAEAVALDMTKVWKPTAENYFGRVTKKRILQAVAEAKGRRVADRIEHLKKPEMAAEAETLIGGTGWLPEPLRTQLLGPHAKQLAASGEETAGDEPCEAATEDGEIDGKGEPEQPNSPGDALPAVAAE